MVRTQSQEFVDDIPGHLPASVVGTPRFDECVRILVLVGVWIHSVEEQVRVDNGHDSAAVHGVVQGIAVDNINTRFAHSMRMQRRQFDHCLGF